MEETEVIIIGAGVLGISLGYHLAQKKIPTILLDREQEIGRHASGKNAGMIRQLYRHPQLTSWANRSILLWPQKLKESCFQQTGSVVVGRQIPNHHQELFRAIEIEILNAKKQKTKTSAILTPTDGLLEPKEYLSDLVELTDQKFCSSCLGEKVIAVEFLADKWTVYTENNNIYKARWLVNAAGAWLNSFFGLPNKKLIVQAQPFARHLFLGQEIEDESFPSTKGFYWDEKQGWYTRPWKNNCRLFSVCDKVPAEPDNFVPNQESKELFKQVLQHSLQEYTAKLQIADSWHCFRTYVEDQLPIWGEDPEAPRLFWLAAFGGFGMSTAFAATFDAAEYISGCGTTISKDFSPDRARVSI